jgi:4-hydroxybenzoate polyprenyltransferase
MLRFREWYHFLALPLAGIDPSLTANQNARAVARGVAVAFCVLGFGYLVNAAGDIKSDFDARKNPLLAGEGALRSAASAWALAGGLATAAVALAACGSAIALGATLVSLASGTLYSIGPRLKAVPVAGTLANATNFAPLLWVGAAGADPSLARRLAPAFAGMLLQSQVLHEAADAAADARAGIRTTFLVLGRGPSAVLAALFGALAAFGPPVGLPASAGLAVVYVLFFPLALALLASDPERAARLRAWHRWSGVVLGAALLAHVA